jgi:hypothetical protein
MTCHIMVQSLFLGQTRLGVILISTDAIAYWQIRAINLDRRQITLFFLNLLPTSIFPHVKPNALLLLAVEFFGKDVGGTFVDP